MSLGPDHRRILAGASGVPGYSRRVRPRLLVLVLALTLAGCGDDEPSAEERRAEVVDRLAADLRAETDGAISRDAAECVAAELVDTVGEGRFDEVVAAAGGDGDPDLRDQVVDVFASCDALDPVQGGG